MQDPGASIDGIGSGLHEMVARGDMAGALQAVACGANPNHHNSDGLQPGQWACGFQSPAVLDQMQALGWMSTHDQEWINQAAHFAISKDNAQALGWLIDKGFDPQSCLVPRTLWSGLALAANCLSINCMRMLASAGANHMALDRIGQGLFHLVASTPHRNYPPRMVYEVLEECLAMGLDVNLRAGAYGDTPAAFAAFSHNLPVLTWLAEHGADLHARNSLGYGLVHATCQGPPHPWSHAVVDYLLGRGVDIVASGDIHPAHFAAARNNPHALKALATHGASLETPLCKEQAQTPVYTAMCSASTEALVFLVAAGVRCDIIDKRGCGLLHLACGRQRIDYPGVMQTMRDLVIAHGIDPDMPNRSRQTPLLHAAQEGSTQAMQAMLDLGASPTAVCLEARNLLHYAALQPDIAPARLAIHATPVAYRSQPDVHGCLPHHLAYRLGHEQVGHLLEAAWSGCELSLDTVPAQDLATPQRRL